MKRNPPFGWVKCAAHMKYASTARGWISFHIKQFFKFLNCTLDKQIFLAKGGDPDWDRRPLG